MSSSPSGDPSGPSLPAPGSSSTVPTSVPCPAPSSGPTSHTGDVALNEVWTAAASPHLVTGDVSVRGGAKLVIEPCAEVRVAKGKHIRVAYPGTPNTGSLVAEGTAEHPIRISGIDGARWASLFVHAPGTARLAHVSFEGGGGGDFDEASTPRRNPWC